MSRVFRPPNVLPLTRRVPFGSHSATQRVALKRGAEAPGHRTARGRVLRTSWAALFAGIAQAKSERATLPISTRHAAVVQVP